MSTALLVVALVAAIVLFARSCAYLLSWPPHRDEWPGLYLVAFGAAAANILSWALAVRLLP